MVHRDSRDPSSTPPCRPGGFWPGCWTVRLEPLVRCRAPKDTLTFVERVDPVAARRVRAEIPPEVLRELENTPRGHFLPLSVARQVTRAWGGAMPRDRAVSYLKGTVLELFESPLLKPMTVAGIRVLGARETTLLRLFPAAWRQIYVNCCEVTFVPTDGHRGELHFTDMHPEFLESFADYSLVIEGILLAGFTLLDSDGRVEFARDPAARRAVVRASWSACVGPATPV